MRCQLEPSYLANVLLYTADTTNYLDFISVSKACGEAARVLKTNPLGTIDLPVSRTLSLFPNINTLQVRRASQLNVVAHLPETITRLVCFEYDRPNIGPGYFDRYTDRVVEIKTVDKQSTRSLAHFTSLEVVGLMDFSQIELPAHQLRRVRIWMKEGDWKGIPSFTAQHCQALDVIFKNKRYFSYFRGTITHPNARVFVNDIDFERAPQCLHDLSCFDLGPIGWTLVREETLLNIDRWMAWPVPDN